VLVAPEVEPAALQALQQAKWGANVRVLELGGLPDATTRHRFVARQVCGGFLLQTADHPKEAPKLQVVTQRAPTAPEYLAMAFAWLVAKHTKSNAIVLARAADDGSCHTVGVGAGQDEPRRRRQDRDRQGRRARQGLRRRQRCVLPVRRRPAGVRRGRRHGGDPAGGSKRDDEVIAAANAAGMAMVCTGQRHFRH